MKEGIIPAFLLKGGIPLNCVYTQLFIDLFMSSSFLEYVTEQMRLKRYFKKTVQSYV